MALMALLACLMLGLGRLAAAEPASPPAPGAVAATAIPGYKLYAGDLLHIQVFDNPDLETEILVPDSGIVSYPLIGEVRNLVGRSVEDFSRELSQRLMNGYLRQAVVTITVKQFGRRTVTVMGSVNSANAVDLDPLRADHRGCR